MSEWISVEDTPIPETVDGEQYEAMLVANGETSCQAWKLKGRLICALNEFELDESTITHWMKPELPK